jgi:hypothetical protein
LTLPASVGTLRGARIRPASATPEGLLEGRSRHLTILFFVVVVAVILGALFLETSRGPTFRAADYADVNECIRNIPQEWRPGSLEREGAEATCYYVHVRNR